MADLIDRKALLNEIVYHLPEHSNGWDVANWQMACIGTAPTIEAEPVRHGRWINGGDFESCSECQGTSLKKIETYYGEAERLWVKTNYCPYCGAKMDLEESDENA